ncbi:FAD:protein FMN transferase [Frankia sp. Hr75.2]|nr:FAD:protein FMN transferase [Frankia sp. Hr75.2]
MAVKDGRSIFAFDAIGTRWEVETGGPLDACLRREIRDRIERFDAVYSRFRPDSLVSRVARAATGGRFDFPDDSAVLFDLYDFLFTVTDGAVDPLVGRDLELLGYDAAYSLSPASKETREQEYAAGRPSWDHDVERDGPTLVTRRPLVIDVGAAGKGYLVDIVTGMLLDAGVSSTVVDASGDLKIAGPSELAVGLEHPRDPRRVVGVAHLRGAALCASAVTKRAWGEGLHHVIDGRTGESTREVLATWTVADRAAVADGLATALFFVSPHRLTEVFEFTWVRMLADQRCEVSSNFVGELFT